MHRAFHLFEMPQTNTTRHKSWVCGWIKSSPVESAPLRHASLRNPYLWGGGVLAWINLVEGNKTKTQEECPKSNKQLAIPGFGVDLPQAHWQVYSKMWPPMGSFLSPVSYKDNYLCWQQERSTPWWQSWVPQWQSIIIIIQWNCNPKTRIQSMNPMPPPLV